MMRAILGSAIGGLVAGAVALVATAQGRTPEAAWPTSQTNPYAMTVAAPGGNTAAATTAPTLVQCEPYQEAVLQRSFVAMNLYEAWYRLVPDFVMTSTTAPVPWPKSTESALVRTTISSIDSK